MSKRRKKTSKAISKLPADDDAEGKKLLAEIKADFPWIGDLLKDCRPPRGFEISIYRYYFQSLKTKEIKVEEMRKIPGWEIQDHLDMFAKLKANLPALEELLEQCREGAEDSIYRFYHHSFKVYHLQSTTLDIVEKLQALASKRPLNPWFMQIVREGTGKKFTSHDNDHWLPVTRPILEAFFHARYFLEMAVKYGSELQEPPLTVLPSGWAGLLYLYNMR